MTLFKATYTKICCDYYPVNILYQLILPITYMRFSPLPANVSGDYTMI